MVNPEKNAATNLQEKIVWLFPKSSQNEYQHAFSRIEILLEGTQQNCQFFFRVFLEILKLNCGKQHRRLDGLGFASA